MGAPCLQGRKCVFAFAPLLITPASNREHLLFWTTNRFGDSKIKGGNDYDDHEKNSNLNGCDFMAANRHVSAEGATPLGLKFPGTFTQGSSVLPDWHHSQPLGFDAQSLWDWVSKRDPLRFSAFRKQNTRRVHCGERTPGPFGAGFGIVSHSKIILPQVKPVNEELDSCDSPSIGSNRIERAC